jgi:hypothetical protein
LAFTAISGVPMYLRSLLHVLAFVLALPLAAATAGSNQVATDFGTETTQIRDSAHGHRMILLGEKHATAEIPRLVAALVADLSQRESVVLALEIPRNEQAALAQYLASDGGIDARAALRSGRFWQVQGDQHDGRRNEDVLDMFEQLRVLNAAQRNVSLLPFDLASGEPRGNHHQRDQAMAAYLREQFEATAQARFVVLTGNVHAMVRKPDRAPPEMQQPMGSYLADLNPYAINISATTGQFWGCRNGQCASTDERPARGQSGPEREGGVYHYQLVLPRFSVARLLGNHGP